MIISTLSVKGGSGKTTTSIALCQYLHSIGRDVTLLDCDPQASSSHWFVTCKNKPWQVATCNTNELRKFSDNFRKSEKIYVCDMPPHTKTLIKVAKEVSNFIVIPITPSSLDWNAVNDMCDELDIRAPACLVINRAAKRSYSLSKCLEKVESLGLNVLKNVIYSRQAIVNSIDAGLTPMATKECADMYNMVFDELLNLIEGKA